MTPNKPRSRNVPKTLRHYATIKSFYNWQDGIKTDENLDLSTVEDDKVDTVAPEPDPLESLLR